VKLRKEMGLSTELLKFAELNIKTSSGAEPLREAKSRRAGVLRRVYNVSTLHESDVKRSVDPEGGVKSHNRFHLLTGFAMMLSAACPDETGCVARSET
jgi:hypothetical protein